MPSLHEPDSNRRRNLQGNSGVPLNYAHLYGLNELRPQKVNLDELIRGNRKIQWKNPPYNNYLN